MSKWFAAASLSLVLTVPQAHAIVLWNQPPDSSKLSLSLIDREFPDSPDYSIYMAQDIAVGGIGGWLVDSVTTYFTSGNGSWPANIDVRLNVFQKSGNRPLASDLPSSGTLYSAAVTADATGLEVTATGLALTLAPGDYWIGLTPVLELYPFSHEYRFTTATLVGDFTAVRNPNGGQGMGTDWVTSSVFTGSSDDFAMRIEGNLIPISPVTELLAAGLLGWLSTRRIVRKPA